MKHKSFKAFKAKYFQDVDDFFNSPTFEDMCEHVAETLENKRVWTFGTYIPRTDEQIKEYYKENNDQIGTFFEDTLDLAPILIKIIREGRVLSSGSQGGLIQERVDLGRHLRGEKGEEQRFIHRQRAYFDFILPKKRAEKVARKLRDLGLIVQSEKSTRYTYWPDGLINETIIVSPTNEDQIGLPVTTEQKIYSNGRKGKIREVTWANGVAPAKLNFRSFESYRPDMYDYLVQNYTKLNVVDPEFGRNDMWEKILKVLKETKATGSNRNPSAKRKTETYVTRLPKGEYYVVDPCYVLGDLYDDFLPDLLKIKNAKAFEYENGKLRRVGNDLQDRTFVVTTDFGGDGTYDGQIRSGGKTRKFGVDVDAGMVSLIPVKMVKDIGQKSMMGPFPKVKFVDMADVVIYKDARGMTTSFEASDGRSTVRVDF